jgi:MFS family permease
MPHAPRTATLSMTQVLICGAAIVTLSMGIRHGFGLWLQPITMDRGWSRETFAFAIAIQNIAWGLAGPFAGMLADRFGAFRVLIVGAILYALGLVGMGLATSGLAFTGSTGVLLGMAQSGTTYAVVYGVIGRNVAPSKRSWAMGVTAAAGSFGQFLMVPVENWLIGAWGWQNALFVLGCLALAIVPLAWGLREPAQAASSGPGQSIGAALKEAMAYPSFRWLMAGYFVCGFQVVFGVQYMSMLGGLVFVSHQIGSFMGVWLGGRLYDSTGSYDIVWWIAVALGVFAALANLPVRETPILRGAPQPA